MPARSGWRSAGIASLRLLTWPTLACAAILCLVTFAGGGGLNPLNPRPMTIVEMALTIGSGVVMAGAVVLTPAHGRIYGLWPVGLLLAFTALTALSTVWSVQPDDSWQDAGRLLAYSGVFAAAVVLARAAPDRWPAVLGGVALASVVVCGYALLTKVFPNRIGQDYLYARLQEPFGYWNATGLTAAMGAIACMWLGARRAGHALLSALAYPAMGLMGVTLMLAYSRGALFALALGLALWFCLVPLRLRGAAVLILGALGAGLVVAWDFSTHALSTDGIPLGERVTAGHQLGVLLAVMVVTLTLAGLLIGFLTGRRAPSRVTRRRAGATLVTLMVLAVIALAGRLAMSQRGLLGSVSHGVSALTDPHAKTPPNTPSRLTAVGSVRARYWNEALKVFQAHPALGAGAAGYYTARLRYRTEPLSVRHAHGYIVQTLADVGLVGLAITLALLAAWLAAAGAATHPFGRRWSGWQWRKDRSAYTAERVGMLSLLCLVVVFGAHSLVDWTWYVPGDACVALLCAGWLAGHGPLAATGAATALGLPSPTGAVGSTEPLSTIGSVSPIEPSSPTGRAAPAGTLATTRQGGTPPRLTRASALTPVRLGVAAAMLVAALLAAWAQWQPLRSWEASNEALALSAANPAAARSSAQKAVDQDPLSAQALITLATIQQRSGEANATRTTLARAVHLQPSNPQTWVALGEYDLETGASMAALNDFRAAVYLNPESVAPLSVIAFEPELRELQNDYLRALRAVGSSAARAAANPLNATNPSAATKPSKPATPSKPSTPSSPVG